MSFLHLLPLQVRTNQPDASAPQGDASVAAANPGTSNPPSSDAGTPPATDASAPSTNDAGNTSQVAPQTPATSNAQSSNSGGLRFNLNLVRLIVDGSYRWRGFQNRSGDPHSGPAFCIGLGWPSLQSGIFSLNPNLRYCREATSARVGEGTGAWTSSAILDSIELGALFNFLVHPNVELGFGGYMGVHMLSASAPTDGRGGLRYSNNFHGFSVTPNNGGVNFGGEATAYVNFFFPRFSDVISLGLGARGFVGGSPFNLTPDAFGRPATDPALPANSVYYGLGLSIIGSFDVNPTPRRSSNPSSNSERPAVANPQTQTEAPQNNPPASAQAPAPATPSRRVSVDRLGSSAFTVPTATDGTSRAVNSAEGLTRFFGDSIRNNEGVRNAIRAAVSEGREDFVLNLQVRYTTQNRGTISVESIQIGNQTYRNGHFPADMSTSSTEIRNMMNAIRDAGLPAFTGNRSRSI
ncbi:MAG: hypothetical protein JNK65_01175, partial [Deltaproteobacteria bacterium]|nr:hypothetical protein [Deltaproteobacteria bacterium]